MFPLEIIHQILIFCDYCTLKTFSIAFPVETKDFILTQKSQELSHKWILSSLLIDENVIVKKLDVHTIECYLESMGLIVCSIANDIFLKTIHNHFHFKSIVSLENNHNRRIWHKESNCLVLHEYLASELKTTVFDLSDLTNISQHIVYNTLIKSIYWIGHCQICSNFMKYVPGNIDPSVQKTFGNYIFRSYYTRNCLAIYIQHLGQTLYLKKQTTEWHPCGPDMVLAIIRIGNMSSCLIYQAQSTRKKQNVDQFKNDIHINSPIIQKNKDTLLFVDQSKKLYEISRHSCSLGTWWNVWYRKQLNQNCYPVKCEKTGDVLFL